MTYDIHVVVLLLVYIRPPLKKSLFAVQRVAEIMATRAAANSFLFFLLFFLVGQILKKSKIKKKSPHPALISPGRSNGNKLFFKGGVIGRIISTSF